MTNSMAMVQKNGQMVPNTKGSTGGPCSIHPFRQGQWPSERHRNLGTSLKTFSLSILGVLLFLKVLETFSAARVPEPCVSGAFKFLIFVSLRVSTSFYAGPINSTRNKSFFNWLLLVNLEHGFYLVGVCRHTFSDYEKTGKPTSSAHILLLFWKQWLIQKITFRETIMSSILWFVFVLGVWQV